MGKCGDEIEQPKALLPPASWPTSWWYIWCPDSNAWWPQLTSSCWHPSTSYWGYDLKYQGGIGWWWWDMAPKSKKLPDNNHRLPKDWKQVLKDDYQTAAIPWSHPKLCSWSLCPLRAKPCPWGGCGLAIWARSPCESSQHRLFGQSDAYQKQPSGKFVIVRMECTGWTVVHGFPSWVGMVLALWRVDGWVIIWSFLVMFWVTFWCFVYFIITSFIFMHEGLCWEFTMWGIMFEMFLFGKGIVAAIGVGLWLSCNW